MTESKALGMLRAKLTCMELEDLACIEKGCDKDCDNCNYCYEQGNRGQSKEALSVAITALSEIQQYREYREIFESHFTEDALKLFSDKEEFSKWFERGKWHVLKCDELGREVEAYRAIGTVSEFRELKEKATAKKVFQPFGTHSYKCPTCWKFVAHEVDDNCDLEATMADYCPYCGQHLDWSEGKEEKHCGNCKHQPEPLTTCDWLKSQTVVFKECPRWERKE